MSGLLRLYPKAWRRRYLAEVSDLLADRPPSRRDQLDLLVGAVDAWIHPQVRADAGNDESPILRPIASSALAILGGGLWSVGGLIQGAAPIDPVTGYKEAFGIVLIIAAAVVTSLAAIGLARSAAGSVPAFRRSAGAMLVFGLLMLAPWPIVAIGFYGHVVATVAFGLILAGTRQGAGLPLVIAALAATSFNTESTMAFAVVPLGLAWLAVGLVGALRGSNPAPAGA